uniref:Uncharacterized protein n=1 Tax=viral metagenome TaxID=1070528 RepID=A0A6C0ICQ0_9ZZZZ
MCLNETMRKSFVAFFLFLVLLAILLGLLWTKKSPESFIASTEQPLRSGIARCHYGGFTPILTCSYQAFQT